MINGIIVFFHGISSHIHSQSEFMFKLAQETGRIVVCPEYWGYFESKEKKDWGYATHNRPLTYFVEKHLHVQLKWIWNCFGSSVEIKQRTTFFGHSLGAYFALSLAIKQPILESLVLLTPFCNLKAFVENYIGKWSKGQKEKKQKK